MVNSSETENKAAGANEWTSTEFPKFNGGDNVNEAEKDKKEGFSLEPVVDEAIDHFKDHPEDIDLMVKDLIKKRGGQEKDGATWDKEQMAYIDANGMPRDWAHLVGHLKDNPDSLKTVLEEYQVLDATEKLKEDPKKIGDMVQGLIKMRGGEEKDGATWDNEQKAYIDANGMPRDWAHLTGYLKQNPDSIKTVLQEYQSLANADALKGSMQSENDELSAKLEAISKRDENYNPLSNEAMAQNETNTGVNAKGQEYERSNSQFDRYPRQKGESIEDYGSRLRWMSELSKITEANPRGENESREEYAARLKSLGAVTLEDFRAHEKGTVDEEQSTAEENDHKRLSREELLEIIKKYPRQEGEDTVAYAQRIYDETGIQIGNSVKKPEQTVDESATDNVAEEEARAAEELEKRRKEAFDLLTGKYKERLGNSKVEDIRKLSVEDMEAMIADLEEEDRKAEEEKKQRADLISRLTDPMVIGDTIAFADVRTREELESLSTDGLKKIAARIFGEDTASAKKESDEDNGEKESAEQRRERILKMAALDETPAEELGRAPGEDGADSSAAEVASAEELEVRRREAFDLLTGKYKDSLGDKKVEDIRKLSVAEMEEQVKRIEANSILDAGKKESLKKPVEWWNRFTDDIHHAVIDGDFSYLGADATRGVEYLTKLVENGLLSKMPENIKLPENDYGFETSQAALGKYDSLINDSMVSRVEFSADEIKALIDDKISDETMASDALRRTLDAEAVWNGASDSERQAILDGSFTDNSSPLYQAYVELGPGAGLIGDINTVRETSLKALDLAADERLLAEANEQAGSFEPIRNADDIRDIPAVSDERLSQIANRALTPDEISRIRKAIYDWNMLENISKQDVLNGDLDYSGDDSLRTSMSTLREFGLIPSGEQEDDATAAAEAYEGNPDVTNIAESAA